MNKEIELLKKKFNKNKPFYILKQHICSELSPGTLKNMLLQTYELGIAADLMINPDISKERIDKIVSFLRKEYLIDKNAANLIVKHWIFLLDLDNYENYLPNPSDLANEFLTGDQESTQSKVRLVGYKDIEVDDNLNENSDHLISEIFLDGLKKGDLEKVKKAVKNGFSIDFKDKENRDALMIWLSKKGYLEILKFLVEQGLDIKNRFDNGRTALMYVAQTNHFELFNYIRSLGLKVDDKDDKGKRVLMYAAENGYLPIVKEIVESGVDINIGTNGYMNVKDRLYSLGKTALMFSVSSKNLEVIDYLLSKGADINATKNGVLVTKNGEIKRIGKNIIMYAIEHGDLKLLKYFVDKGAQINIKDEFNNSALIYAVIKKDKETVKYLINQGISIDDLNNNHLNALIYAIKINDFEMVKLLINEGAIIEGDFYSSEEKQFKKPIHYAIQEDNQEIIKYLVNKIDNLNETDKDGKTPLMYAIQKKNIKLIKILLNNKVDAKIKDKNDNDALWYAAKEGNGKIISMIENYLKKDNR